MPVFEQGYKHWDGELSGHGARWYTIARQGIRVALQGWILRLLVLFALAPAVVLVGIFVLWGLMEQQAEWIMPIARAIFTHAVVQDPGSYRVIIWTLAFRFFFMVELFTAMILVLVVGPGLISQDLRFNAIPLYFSRPLYRWDYFLGKLGVIAFFLGLVAIVPALVAYLFGVLFSFKLEVITTTWHLVPGSIAYGLVIVLSAGTLMLALSSLSRSSRYVAGFWIGLWFLSNTVASVMSTIHMEQAVHRARVEAQQVMQMPNANDPEALARHQEALRDREMQQRGRRFPPWHTARQDALLNDWRPMFSYTNNLDRVGRYLLDVDAIADRFVNEILPPQMPPEARNEVRLVLAGSQYPWYWSALVLLVLFGASLWLLTTRVRTLDRLS